MNCHGCHKSENLGHITIGCRSNILTCCNCMKICMRITQLALIWKPLYAESPIDFLEQIDISNDKEIDSEDFCELLQIPYKRKKTDTDQTRKHFLPNRENEKEHRASV